MAADCSALWCRGEQNQKTTGEQPLPLTRRRSSCLCIDELCFTFFAPQHSLCSKQCRFHRTLHRQRPIHGITRAQVFSYLSRRMQGRVRKTSVLVPDDTDDRWPHTNQKCNNTARQKTCAHRRSHSRRINLQQDDTVDQCKRGYYCSCCVGYLRPRPGTKKHRASRSLTVRVLGPVPPAAMSSWAALSSAVNKLTSS